MTTKYKDSTSLTLRGRIYKVRKDHDSKAYIVTNAYNLKRRKKFVCQPINRVF